MQQWHLYIHDVYLWLYQICDQNVVILSLVEYRKSVSWHLFKNAQTNVQR